MHADQADRRFADSPRCGIILSMKRTSSPAPDLFDHAAQAIMARSQPLAARMRARSLDEYVGQEDIVGPGRLLRRAIESDKLFSSFFLWGRRARARLRSRRS